MPNSFNSEWIHSKKISHSEFFKFNKECIQIDEKFRKFSSLKLETVSQINLASQIKTENNEAWPEGSAEHTNLLLKLKYFKEIPPASTNLRQNVHFEPDHLVVAPSL